MSQPEHAAAEAAAEGFNASEVILEHVSNTPIDHPLIPLGTLWGIDLSVTKHVLMIWLVAGGMFVLLTWVIRRYLRQDQLVPSGFMNALEAVVEFLRDSVVEPNIGRKGVGVWAPLLLTFFFFILGANLVGLIPVFDVLSLVNHTVLQLPAESFPARVLHGSSTATGNFNVTAALATVTFFAIIVAGVRAHGFVQHWLNLAPHGMALPIRIFVAAIEFVGMFIKPFALTMRLAANMTGGHIAILAILSFVFIFTDLFGQVAGMSIGMLFSVPLAVGVSALEIIVVLVQAYVFTLLSAVFIGMAIHVHH